MFTLGQAQQLMLTSRSQWVKSQGVTDSWGGAQGPDLRPISDRLGSSPGLPTPAVQRGLAE